MWKQLHNISPTLMWKLDFNIVVYLELVYKYFVLLYDYINMFMAAVFMIAWFILQNRKWQISTQLANMQITNT